MATVPHRMSRLSAYRVTKLLSKGLHLYFERYLVFSLNDLWEGHKLVDKLLAHHFLDNVLVVVISEGTTEFVVVHVVFVLAQSPLLGYLFRVDQFELAFIVRPLDDVTMLVA